MLNVISVTFFSFYIFKLTAFNFDESNHTKGKLLHVEESEKGKTPNQMIRSSCIEKFELKSQSKNEQMNKKKLEINSENKKKSSRF